MNYTEIKDKLFIVMDIVLVVCFLEVFLFNLISEVPC